MLSEYTNAENIISKLESQHDNAQNCDIGFMVSQHDNACVMTLN